MRSSFASGDEGRGREVQRTTSSRSMGWRPHWVLRLRKEHLFLDFSFLYFQLICSPASSRDAGPLTSLSSLNLFSPTFAFFLLILDP